jgi:hypothetical protein
MAKFTYGYRHNTDMDTNRKKDTNAQGQVHKRPVTQTDRDRDTNGKGQGHERTGTGTQVDRDTDGQGLGHR